MSFESNIMNGLRGKIIFNQNYNEMNFIKQVNTQPHHSNPYTRTQYPYLPYTQNYRINPSSKRVQHTIQMTQQQQQRQTLELQAKKHLFQQSEIHNHKDINKSYGLKKTKKVSKSMMLQTQDQITAFQYQYEPPKQSNYHLYRHKNTKSNQTNPTNKRELRFQIPNHQIYWNKKHNAQVMILRPTILNPNMLNHERTESFIKIIDQESSNKKDVQKIINKIIRHSKDSVEITANYNMQRYKKRARIRSIQKKMVHLRSKSTNFIEQYQRTQLLNQFEKVNQGCAFDLQIKCLQSQKQLIDANKTKTVKSNKDLKQKIRHLLTKQGKGNNINNNKQKVNQSFQDLNIKNQSKAQKLQVIQNRSKSCIVSTWKGGQNKKVKIGHILSKFAKFKTEQLENKRKLILQRQGEQRKSVQLLKINIKIQERTQKERENVVKLHQEHPDSKKGLINSIKLYCNEQNANKLPFVTSLLANHGARSDYSI